MGTYRLLLAIAVALSHMGVQVGGLNPGVMAVISFFLISGFVMTGLVRTYYMQLHSIHLFYVDRAARIFPQYLFFLLGTLLCHWALGFKSPFLGEATLFGLFANVTVIPMDFYMFSPAVAQTMYIPQAWSLGLELMFYLMFPLIIIGKVRMSTLLLSLLVWIAAAFGAMNADIWGYRLLPGTLFMFLLGSCIYDARKPSLRHPAVLVLLVGIGCAVALSVTGKLESPYNREVMLGLLVGVVVLFYLAQTGRGAWDDWLGNLSYGVFLCHFLVIWLFETMGIGRNAWTIGLMVVVSVVLAYASYMGVERPVLQWRYRLRKKRVG